jgi:hypothetical protein
VNSPGLTFDIIIVQFLLQIKSCSFALILQKSANQTGVSIDSMYIVHFDEDNEEKQF